MYVVYFSQVLPEYMSIGFDNVFFLSIDSVDILIHTLLEMTWSGFIWLRVEISGVI
jgi:hypothetical protein